jgi:hypothetical protein
LKNGDRAEKTGSVNFARTLFTQMYLQAALHQTHGVDQKKKLVDDELMRPFCRLFKAKI